MLLSITSSRVLSLFLSNFALSHIITIHMLVRRLNIYALTNMKLKVLQLIHSYLISDVSTKWADIDWKYTARNLNRAPCNITSAKQKYWESSLRRRKIHANNPWLYSLHNVSFKKYYCVYLYKLNKIIQIHFEKSANALKNIFKVVPTQKAQETTCQCLNAALYCPAIPRTVPVLFIRSFVSIYKHEWNCDCYRLVVMKCGCSTHQ
jgi:hypothetical protein